MSPEDVPEELLEAAELALAGVCPSDQPGTLKDCTCPTFSQQRIIIAAVYDTIKNEGARDLLLASVSGWEPREIPEPDVWVCPYDSAELDRNTGPGWMHFECPSCHLRWTHLGNPWVLNKKVKHRSKAILKDKT